MVVRLAHSPAATHALPCTAHRDVVYCRGFKILKPTFHMTIKVEEQAEA